MLLRRAMLMRLWKHCARRVADCAPWVVTIGLGLLPLMAGAAELPPADAVTPVLLLTVDRYSEGVVFDADGRGYISHGETITRFNLDGTHAVWAMPGGPNGHKILPDGTHLVCNNAPPAVIKLAADGTPLATVVAECDGQPLRGPNDLTLDLPHGGFYFTDPGGSGRTSPIGTVHYVAAAGTVSQVAAGLAFPNGIVLTADGTRLLVAESQHNRILEYPVLAPGKLGPQKVFANLPLKTGPQTANEPDGMCLDTAGNLYVAHYGMGQVQVLGPTGTLLRQYDTGLPLTSNVAFGGQNRTALFVTGATETDATPGGVARLELTVPGLPILPPGNR